MFVTSMFAAFDTICSKASSLLGRARTKSCATLLQKNICSPSATAAPTPWVESKDAVLLTFLTKYGAAGLCNLPPHTHKKRKLKLVYLSSLSMTVIMKT